MVNNGKTQLNGMGMTIANSMALPVIIMKYKAFNFNKII